MSNDEMQAACKAIEDGDFAQARHHLNNMSMDGTHPSTLEQLNNLIVEKETAASKLSLNRIGTALAVAILGYAVLSFRTPAAWGPIIWGLAAFLVLPMFAGAIAGTSVVGGKSKRFWRAFWITALTVVCYTWLGLGLTRAKMHSSEKSSDIVIFFVVAVVYGGLAGLIAGVAGTAFSPARKAS